MANKNDEYTYHVPKNHTITLTEAQLKGVIFALEESNLDWIDRRTLHAIERALDIMNGELQQTILVKQTR